MACGTCKGSPPLKTFAFKATVVPVTKIESVVRTTGPCPKCKMTILKIIRPALGKERMFCAACRSEFAIS